MLSLLFNFIKAGLFGLLLNDYLKRSYPDKYNNFLITTSFELIHLYSKSQIFYKKIVLQINTLIDSNPQLKTLINDIYKKDVDHNVNLYINGDYTYALTNSSTMEIENVFRNLSWKNTNGWTLINQFGVIKTKDQDNKTGGLIYDPSAKIRIYEEVKN